MELQKLPVRGIPAKRHPLCGDRGNIMQIGKYNIDRLRINNNKNKCKQRDKRYIYRLSGHLHSWTSLSSLACCLFLFCLLCNFRCFSLFRVNYLNENCLRCFDWQLMNYRSRQGSFGFVFAFGSAGDLFVQSNCLPDNYDQLSLMPAGWLTDRRLFRQ